jgi:16S rRNA (cytosine1402-N4)-methyltransferase
VAPTPPGAHQPSPADHPEADPPAHRSVLLAEALFWLRPRPGGAYVDATVGAGGHARAVLEASAPDGRLLGLDLDADALRLAADRLRPFGDRVRLVQASFRDLPDVLAAAGLVRPGPPGPQGGDRAGGADGADGVLFDLGVSSMQLDLAERGFAYSTDAPLDMRMDATTGPTAADILNTYDVAELTRVLKEYGEERFARKIAAAIVRAREVEPFTTSGRLVDLLYAEIPAPARRTGGHPAKRTFQALRMEVNDELAVLRRAIPAAIDAIRVGGRVVVESYHSLEDRIVKQAFAAATSTDVPDDLPFVPEGHEPAFRLITRGAEKADPAEIAANPRAASVRLRAIERVRPSERGAA